MNSIESGYWRKCSSCKTPISFSATYWACSVSTCNRKRNPMVFCTDECWDAHLPVMNHREASCLERSAPSEASIRSEPKQSGSNRSSEASSDAEILVVASKVKDYIRTVSGMNTSASAFHALSDYVRKLSDAAMKRALDDGRQTVMDRDFSAPRSKASGVIIRRPKRPD